MAPHSTRSCSRLPSSSTPGPRTSVNRPVSLSLRVVWRPVVSGRWMGRCRWLRGFVTIAGCRIVTPPLWCIVAGSSTSSLLSPRPGVRVCLSAGQISALKASCPTAVEPVMGDHQVRSGRHLLPGCRSPTPSRQPACGGSVPKLWSSCLNRSNRYASYAPGVVRMGWWAGWCSMMPVRSSSCRRSVPRRPGTGPATPVTVPGVAPTLWWRSVRSSTPTTNSPVPDVGVRMSKWSSMPTP